MESTLASQLIPIIFRNTSMRMLTTCFLVQSFSESL